MLKLRYAIPVLVPAFMAVCLLSAGATPVGPQTIALSVTQVDVSRPPMPGRPRAPIPVPRHLANPALVAEIKAAYAKSGGAKPQHTPRPSPSSSATPTPTSSSSPTATPTPAPPLAISSGVQTRLTSFTSFDAMNLWDGGGFVPPDTTIAAGAVPTGTATPTMLVEGVNSMGAVYDSGGSLLVNLSTTACTTNSSTDSVSDPRVLFDAGSGRWFISTVTFSPMSDASWNVLVSTSSDPTVSIWNCLVIPTGNIRNPDGSTGNFPDFPKIGINSDKVVLTGDAYSQTGANSYKFQGTEYIVLDKSGLTSATGTVNAAMFKPNQRDFAIEPAQHLDYTSADPLYMAAVNSALASTSTIDVWTINGVPGSAVNPLQTPTVTSLPIATISTPPNAQQQGTGVLLDTNDDSLLDAVFREGAPGSLWVSANDACRPPGDNTVRSCTRFINVSISAKGAMSVAQDFDYADVGTYYYFPAVITDAAGDLFAAFTGSSTTLYASAYGAVQKTGTVNQITNLSLTRGGDSPYSVSPPRWGDYSGASVDPGDKSAWLGAEYATSNIVLGPYWGTAIAHVSP